MSQIPFLSFHCHFHNFESPLLRANGSLFLRLLLITPATQSWAQQTRNSCFVRAVSHSLSSVLQVPVSCVSEQQNPPFWQLSITLRSYAVIFWRWKFEKVLWELIKKFWFWFSTCGRVWKDFWWMSVYLCIYWVGDFFVLPVNTINKNAVGQIEIQLK